MWQDYYDRRGQAYTQLGNVLGGGVFVGMSYWGAYLRPLSEARTKGA